MATKKRKIVNDQQTLFAVGVTRPSITSTPTEIQGVISEETDKSRKQPQRKFQPKWLKLYESWLFVDKVNNGENEEEVMKCRLCISAKRKNVFTAGCQNFKTSTLNDHMKGRDHQIAILAPTLQDDLNKSQSKQYSSKEQAIIVALKSVHWLIKENIPLSKFDSFVTFQKSVGVDVLGGLNVSPGILYTSDYSANELLKALSKTIESEIQSSLEKSQFITVLVDESTDRTVTHRLVIYCQYIDEKMTPKTQFLTNIQLDSGTGAAVSSAIYAELAVRGVKADKIMGLGTDGAAAMTGKNKGCTGMMLRRNPHLINVHCIAHRLALCTSQAAEVIPAMKAFQETLTTLFYYFKYSTCRVAKLRQVQDVLDSPQLKFKEVHQVRWMSFYAALEAVYRCLDPLLTYLAGSELSDPKAQGLKKKIACLKFVSMVYILMDIIPVVTKLNLFFQKELTDISMVKVKTDHTVNDLKKLKTSEGEHEQLLKTEIVNGRYKEHSLTMCPATDILSVKQKFISSLIENIEKRFPDTDLLSAFGILALRPVGLGMPEEEVAEWGNIQMKLLLEHFGKEKQHTYTNEENEKQTVTSEPIVDYDKSMNEWKELKTTVRAQLYPRDQILTLWQLIAKFHKEEFPNLLKLAEIALTCPINTAGCERGFSAQNQILSPLRNRLTPEHQDLLLRVKINGAKMDNFDFDKAFSIWKSSTDRKMFK